MFWQFYCWGLYFNVAKFTALGLLFKVKILELMISFGILNRF